MNNRTTQTLDAVESCVDAVLARVGKHVVLGLPVGIGKPNTLVNAFVRRAVADSNIKLSIYTALSFSVPRAHNDLERRFLEPFARRVFGDYPELEYVELLRTGRLPANIEISEFFLNPGAWLQDAELQQHYLSANYTHVARDLLKRGVNVIAQLIAPPRDGTVSLSCNPDLAVDLLPHFASLRAAGKPCALIGVVHSELPYMFGDAVVSRDVFDFILEAPSDPLFAPPNLALGTTDYLIAANVSALIRDGGTLQIGIGELGDAIVYALKLRHEHPEDYKAVLDGVGSLRAHSQLVANEGGTVPFARGLYGCTEMLVDGFLDLHRAGILRRRVYPHAVLQRLLDAGEIFEAVNEETLEALANAGLARLSESDFKQLHRAGVFRENCRYDRGRIVTSTEREIEADLANKGNRALLAEHCLGSSLQNGALLHGGFFFGPKSFYEALRAMPDDVRRDFAMQSISMVNELYGAEQSLKVAQRRFARFVNTTMMVTGLGAAVSDGLADGRVVSGVGGQYNFVAMAHALPDARSILCVRSTRTAAGRTSSNIVWNYGHVTIPRHLRDIVVTEYGIADLRGRTDREVVEALVQIMDARFQDTLVNEAKRSGKLPADYVVPESARANTPERLEKLLRPFRARNFFPEFPFGTDFTPEEIVIAKALKHMQAATATPSKRMSMIAQALFAKPNAAVKPYLERLELARPRSPNEWLLQRLVTTALRAVTHAPPA